MNGIEMEALGFIMTSIISSMRFFRQLRPYDRLTLGYLALVLLFLAISPQRTPAALRIIVVHSLAIIMILLLARYADRSRLLQVVHDFYPMALFMALFSEFTHLATALFPHWLEPLLINFDKWAFGGSPQQWTARHASPFVIELLAFSYWSYYLVIPGTLFLVYKKNYPHELTAATTRLCLTMYACYVMFMLSPARGPHHALAGNGALMIEGGFFTNFVHTIQKIGSVRGAAFPSSHVAVAWAMFFVLQRHSRKIAWLAGPLIAALTVSVITMGYHFSLDALGGVVVAFGINAALDRQEVEVQPERESEISDQ
jgi:membrane-associated phospholipid phosphatase